MEDHKHPSLSSSRNSNGDSPRQDGPSRRYAARPVVLVLTVLAGLSWWLLPVSMEREINLLPGLPDPQFAWNQITPSEALEYHDCFGGFQCARLDVPMDWHRSDGQGSRVAIAVTRLPAKVPVTDPRYGGAIVINPGGPGGSGVTQALLDGRNLQTIADASVLPTSDVGDDPKYFDIIGFDPRGVNNTTPGFSCFPNLFSQKNWELQAEADGMLGSSTDSFMRNWQRAIALNIGCSQALSIPSAEGDILGEHLNTPPVARDVLEIIERHGEWREKQAQSQYNNCQGHGLDQSMLTRTKWRRGREKLIYWGRSYGTVIGTTFAALYPDRVERVVLDGVVDAERYYTGVGPEPIVDADNVFDKFTVYCNTIGEDCPFYVGGGPAAIKEAYKDIENGLFNSSLAVQPSTTRGPEVVTWTDLKTVQRIAIYQPLIAFSYLAGTARDLIKGDGSALADFKHGRRAPICPSAECLISGPWSPDCQGTGQNEMYATSAILCGDAEYLQDVDEEAFIQHWRSLNELSSTFGNYWAHTHLNCVGWKMKPKWKMPVPVTGNTSHPILFVNNILDPITPLQSAKTMSAAFPGSILLRQDSEGHCTLAAPSTCIAQSIRKYFQKGKLPEPGTVCDADLKPLLGAPNKMDNKGKTLDEIALDKALLEDALRPRTQFPL